eukprot:scaffold107504_cov33-Tisochrysis_lutea.AAC.1
MLYVRCEPSPGFVSTCLSDGRGARIQGRDPNRSLWLFEESKGHCLPCIVMVGKEHRWPDLTNRISSGPPGPAGLRVLFCIPKNLSEALAELCGDSLVDPIEGTSGLQPPALIEAIQPGHRIALLHPGQVVDAPNIALSAQLRLEEFRNLYALLRREGPRVDECPILLVGEDGGQSDEEERGRDHCAGRARQGKG